MTGKSRRKIRNRFTKPSRYPWSMLPGFSFNRLRRLNPSSGRHAACRLAPRRPVSASHSPPRARRRCDRMERICCGHVLLVARTGPSGPDGCPLIGAKRKWRFGDIGTAFDPTRTREIFIGNAKQLFGAFRQSARSLTSGGMVRVPRNPFMRNVRLDRRLFAAISEPPSGVEHDRDFIFVYSRSLYLSWMMTPECCGVVARMLKQFGYASFLFASAEAFTNQSDFEGAICIILDINLTDGSGIELRCGLKAAGNTCLSST